jgi:hypothetical protein
MLLPHDVSVHKISLFIQLSDKELAILYRLTTSSSQVNSESKQYRRDFVIFLSYNCAKSNVFLASLMEKFPNEVDSILTKDAFSFQDIKNRFLNLHLAAGNGDSAHYMFGNKKNKKSKKGTKSSGSCSSKPGPFFNSKDNTSSSNTKTCTWYTKHHPSKANGHGRHECPKLKEFNKLLTLRVSQMVRCNSALDLAKTNVGITTTA